MVSTASVSQYPIKLQLHIQHNRLPQECIFRFKGVVEQSQTLYMLERTSGSSLHSVT